MRRQPACRAGRQTRPKLHRSEGVEAVLRSVQIDYMLERGYALDALAGFLSRRDRGLELAKIDGELAGFAAWYVTEDPREAKLDKLYVLQTHQRHGLGGRLIERVEELARKAG